MNVHYVMIVMLTSDSHKRISNLYVRMNIIHHTYQKRNICLDLNGRCDIRWNNVCRCVSFSVGKLETGLKTGTVDSQLRANPSPKRG